MPQNRTIPSTRKEPLCGQEKTLILDLKSVPTLRLLISFDHPFPSTFILHICLEIHLHSLLMFILGLFVTHSAPKIIHSSMTWLVNHVKDEESGCDLMQGTIPGFAWRWGIMKSLWIISRWTAEPKTSHAGQRCANHLTMVFGPYIHLYPSSLDVWYVSVLFVFIQEWSFWS